MAFAGILGLRPGDERVKMQPWQLEELAKCAVDPIYFINTYVTITTKDEGTTLFKMWDFQEDLIRKFNKHRFNIVKFPRQCGKCSHGNTTIEVMNDKNEVMSLKINELYNLLKQ